jgi:pyruvate carboxylase
LGQPPFGFPEPFRTRILTARRLPKIEGRPGQSLAPVDFVALKKDLEEVWGEGHVADNDVLSAALYPKVNSPFECIEYGNDKVLLGV